MKDVEYGSQLLGYLLRGIVSDTAAGLNELYDTYNDIFEQKSKLVKEAADLFDQIELLFKDAEVHKFFSKSIHFYALFAVLQVRSKPIDKHLVKNLKKFVDEYVNQDFDEENVEKYLADYKRGSSYTTAGKPSRERRVYSLLDYLTNA